MHMGKYYSCCLCDTYVITARWFRCAQVMYNYTRSVNNFKFFLTLFRILSINCAQCKPRASARRGRALCWLRSLHSWILRKHCNPKWHWVCVYFPEWLQLFPSQLTHSGSQQHRETTQRNIQLWSCHKNQWHNWLNIWISDCWDHQLLKQ